MLIETDLEDQLSSPQHDRLRVLIVGAGVAGLTLAALLRRGGLHPVLVEKRGPASHPGYMLALTPTADTILNDLDVRDEYLARSRPVSRYAFASHRGRRLRSDDLGGLLSSYGDYRGIERGALLEVLATGGIPITHRTSVAAIEVEPASATARATTARATFAGTTAAASFDLIVAADGIGSDTRSLLPTGALDGVRTGWGGWVGWCDSADDSVEELWGDGFFLGVYPVLGRLGVFLGGPEDATRVGPARFADAVRAAAPELDERLRGAVAAIAHDPDPYFWPLSDVRSERWVTPGAVLLGDAAAGFLPTAGIGAGMAMEAAWMLGRMLVGADRDGLTAVLAEWERTERPRVEAAQANSRALARLMFRRGRVTAGLRETVMRVVPLRAALGPIIRLVATQPDPDAALARALRASAPDSP